MVPRKARLPREEFNARGYKRAATPFFSLKIKNNETDSNRFGVIVGKSVDKRATRRNTLERKVKAELLRLPNVHQDVIITIFPKANTITEIDFQREIKKILKSSLAL